MFFRRACLRFAVLAAFLAAFLGPIAASAASLECDDFANPAAAQHLLDADDAYAGDLDPDGDGIACNEGEESAGEPGAVAYFDDVWEEVDRVTDSLMFFMETYYYAAEDTTTGDDFDAAIEELTELAAMWVAYPDEAPAFDVPAGYEQIDDEFQAFAGSVSEVGQAWETYWNTSGNEEANFASFNDAFVAAQEQAFVVMDLIVEAEEELGIEQGDATDDPRQQRG